MTQRVDKSIDSCESVHTECLRFVALTESLKACDEEAVKDNIIKFEALKDKAMDRWEAAELMKKKVKSFLDGA